MSAASATALSVEEASGRLLAEVRPSGAEDVPLEECLGRVTAAPVRTLTALPPFDNSAMDGFAVRSVDLAGGPRQLRIVAESRAGHPATVSLGAGEATRISTGAVMPDGADAVVLLEQAREDGETVLPAAAVRAGANVRRAGEDLEAGVEALPAGRLVGAAELGVLASVGLPTVSCARRPTVAVLTSGDELLDPGETPRPGQIHNSNRFALTAMAQEAGAAARYAGNLPDDLGRTREAIAAVLDSDLVVITGGVSVGRHDHVKDALAELGVEQLFWGVAMRPGAPVLAAALRRPGGRTTLVFGLPGNPVSAVVTFRLFALPAILVATGRDPGERRTVAALAASYEKKPGRVHCLRCRLQPGPQGWRATLTRELQGSHVVSSMLGADCLAVIPAERERVEAGEQVEVLLL